LTVDEGKNRKLLARPEGGESSHFGTAERRFWRPKSHGFGNGILPNDAPARIFLFIKKY